MACVGCSTLEEQGTSECTNNYHTKQGESGKKDEAINAPSNNEDKAGFASFEFERERERGKSEEREREVRVGGVGLLGFFAFAGKWEETFFFFFFCSEDARKNKKEREAWNFGVQSCRVEFEIVLTEREKC